MAGLFSMFSKKKEERSMKAKMLLREKYSYFQNLLKTNNEVLSLMAEITDKLSGDYVFDNHFVKTTVDKTSEGVLEIIKNLNYLSENKYEKLLEKYEQIKEKINKALYQKIEIPVTDYTIPLEALSKDSVIIAGGKMAHLAEIKNILKVPSPDGFVITSYAFLKVIEYNNLKDEILKLIEHVNINKLEELENSSNKIKELIVNLELPEDLVNSIKNSYEELCKKIGYKCKVSVRSSAIYEDSLFSFAGQYSSFLNVREDMILQKYKEVMASLFNPRAVFYYKTKGFSDADMVMAVGVLPMIDAKAGGVMYTKDPNNPESGNLIINSVRGLGKLVVDGSVSPDIFYVRKENLSIAEKKMGTQDRILVCREDGDIEEVCISPDISEPSLEDEIIIKLAKIGTEIEEFYNSPQDIEWVVDKKGNIFIVQTRLLRIFEKFDESKVLLPTRLPNYTIILDRGLTACKGVGYGKAFILKNDDELEKFPDGHVLVAKHTNPKYVVVMKKATAIITDVGSPTGHMASIAREYKVPTILNAEVATKSIKHGQEITVDATNCIVYDGKVSELLDAVDTSRDSFRETLVFKTLENVSKYIVPLNLIDPMQPNFRIENCETYHDITRYCHEMVMHEMFTMWESYDSEIHAIPLIAKIPISVLILDIEGGLKESTKKAKCDDIESIPFRAILDGMTKMRWPDPPPVDTGGFLGMIANTATTPEEQLLETGKKSFCVITKNYMNFSIRLGYHFSMIEAYAGENINDNYIKFFFKGGGAAFDRRLRRVRLIKTILERLAFRVKVTDDVIDAILTKYPLETIKLKLEILGKLTAYTKQLDMTLFNDAVAEMFTEDFIRQHIPKDL